MSGVVTKAMLTADPMTRGDILKVLARARYAHIDSTVCILYKQGEYWAGVHSAAEVLPTIGEGIHWRYNDHRCGGIPMSHVYALTVNPKGEQCTCAERELEAMKRGE